MNQSQIADPDPNQSCACPIPCVLQLRVIYNGRTVAAFFAPLLEYTAGAGLGLGLGLESMPGCHPCTLFMSSCLCVTHCGALSLCLPRPASVGRLSACRRAVFVNPCDTRGAADPPSNHPQFCHHQMQIWEGGMRTSPNRTCVMDATSNATSNHSGT